MSSPDRSSIDGDPPEEYPSYGSRNSRVRGAVPPFVAGLDHGVRPPHFGGSATLNSQSSLQQLQSMLRPSVASHGTLPSPDHQLWQRLDALNAVAAENQRRETLRLDALNALAAEHHRRENVLHALMVQPDQGRQSIHSRPSWPNDLPSQLGLNRFLQRYGTLPSINQSINPIQFRSAPNFTNPPLPPAAGFAQSSSIPTPLHAFTRSASLPVLSQPLLAPTANRFLNYEGSPGTNRVLNHALQSSYPYIPGAPPDLGTIRTSREEGYESEMKHSHRHEQEEMKVASLPEPKSDSSESSHDKSSPLLLGDRVFPSERSSLALKGGTSSPREAYRVMKVLGSTLRSKKDPFIDVASLPDPQGPGENRVIRGSDRFFPDQLHSMLMEIEREGTHTDVVSFMPHGRAFRVHKKERFISEVLPNYFGGQGKWTSFLRQVKLYGFLRVSSGSDCNAYYHELFLRSKPELTKFMRRVGTPKGLDRRTYRIAEGDDPDFDQLPPLGDPPESPARPAAEANGP
jgi:HSF-type DNA-binding